MHISNTVKNNLRKLLECKKAVSNKTLEFADYAEISKSIRSSLDGDDQFIYDCIMSHALKCELKSPLGFEKVIENLLDTNNKTRIFRKFHISDCEKVIEKYSTSLVAKNIVDFLIKNRNLDATINFALSETENSIELQNGYNFYIRNLLNIKETKINSCGVILIDGIIENVSEIHLLLTKATELKTPIVLICRDFSNDVINTLSVNYQRKTLNVIPIKASLEDLDNLNIFSDLASVTLSNVITSEKGDLISSVRLESVKFVDSITILEDRIIIENDGAENFVLLQLKKLKERLENNNEIEDKVILIEKRIKSLSSKTAVIRVKRGINSTFMQREIDKILRLLKHSIKFGIDESSLLPASTIILSEIHSRNVIKTIESCGEIL